MEDKSYFYIKLIIKYEWFKLIEYYKLSKIISGV